jgi:four helix bundle protein
MSIKSYRDLLCWQKAMGLVTDVYRITGKFPKEELYGLTSQVRRCAVSIPSNIAEGFGRHSTNDYIRFLQIASGSLYELQTQIEISCNLGYVDKSNLSKILELINEIERMLSTLISKLQNQTK